MTVCPDSGALRAAMDGERPDVASHVSQCASCQAHSTQLAATAAFAAKRFPAPPPVDAADTDAALAQLRGRDASAEVTVLPRRQFGAGLMRVAAGLISVVLVGAVLSTGSGRAAAAAFLERFR